ncbi:hypothetical protein, partial [Salmonella enterica]|uniref:hypothetical protein n=1 Tax=Salmonella enterica TaxID=28901 RepID=UPI00352515D1
RVFFVKLKTVETFINRKIFSFSLFISFLLFVCSVAVIFSSQLFAQEEEELSEPIQFLIHNPDVENIVEEEEDLEAIKKLTPKEKVVPVLPTYHLEKAPEERDEL